MNIEKTLNRIRELGMSQREFCKKIGVDERTFANYKKKPESIRYGTLVKMARELNCSREQIYDIFFS